MSDFFKIILKKIRLITIGNQREKALANYFFKIILNNNLSKKIKIIDYGAGYEPKVSFFLLEKLENYGKLAEIDCYDFYREKELTILNSNKKNINFLNLKNLKQNKKKYDFSIISDVLHHIGVNKEKLIVNILKRLKSKSKFILIKDHFETGFFSRTILRFMDFIGNYHNNVNIPKKYFCKKKFLELINSTKLKIKSKNHRLHIYNKIYFFSYPELHFMYLLK